MHVLSRQEKGPESQKGNSFYIDVTLYLHGPKMLIAKIWGFLYVIREQDVSDDKGREGRGGGENHIRSEAGRPHAHIWVLGRPSWHPHGGWRRLEGQKGEQEAGE